MYNPPACQSSSGGSTLTDPSLIHVTFTFQRTCHAAVERVFRAFADPQEKMRWQDSPEVQPVEPDAEDDYLEFEFRVGGHERFAFKVEGVTYEYDAQYFDIVPDRRIVYRYTMAANGRPDSISIVTIELAPDGSDTTLTYTEQGTFLDGIDDPDIRQAGMSVLLDNLAVFVALPAR